jgi:hypothetical protein
MRISSSLIIAFTCVFALILPCVLGKDIYLSPNGVGTSRWRLIARYSDLLIGDILRVLKWEPILLLLAYKLTRLKHWK